MSFKRCASN